MDALSFLIALTLILTLSSVALVGNWLQRRRVPGLLMMALGSFPITGGALLFVLQNFQLPPLITVFAANSLLLGGRLIQLFGLAAFWRQTESRSTTFSALAYLPAVVGFGYFTLIESSQEIRIGIHSLTTIVLSIATVDVIGYGIAKRRLERPFSAIVPNFGAYALVAISIFLCFAEIALAYLRLGVGVANEQVFLSLVLLDAIALSVVSTIGIILMTFEEHRVERLERSPRDPTTGELNPLAFEEVGTHLLQAAHSNGTPVALFVIEIGNLPELAKTHGYGLTNQLVVMMLKNIRAMVTEECALCRYRFDRVVLLCPNTSASAARLLLLRLEDKTREPFSLSRDLPTPAARIVPRIIAAETDSSERDLRRVLHEAEVELIRLKLAY